MANWQISYLLAPKQWLLDNRKYIENFLGQDGWELQEAFENFSKSRELFKTIQIKLPRFQAISDDYWAWKSSNHDSDISLGVKGNMTENIRIRIDKRAEPSELYDFLDALIDICEKYDLFVLDMRHSLILSPEQFRNQHID